jgi:site-specific DNA-cytosine methylase
MQINDALIINSYAGSLTIGAQAVGIPIRGSYEDSGYAIDIQKANFPKLDFRDTFAQWPKTQDLSQTILLAHPPCSAFSLMTPKVDNRRGVTSDAFDCTKKVLRYGMKNKAAAIAVESVPAAMEGARAVHDSYAKRYGYHLYRIQQNAVSFGVPQWRPRFWAVFVRQDAADAAMTWTTPKPARYTRLSDVLDEFEPGPVVPELVYWFDRQSRQLRENGFSETQIQDLYQQPGSIVHNIRKFHAPEADLLDVKNQYVGKGIYFSHALRMLDPEGFATTVLGNSVWLYRGKPVGNIWFRLIMGFPPEYVFPGEALMLASTTKTKTSKVGDVRTYLSKGVCPPVATWITKNLLAHLTGSAVGYAGWTETVRPGDIGNFNLKKKEALPDDRSSE